LFLSQAPAASGAIGEFIEAKRAAGRGRPKCGAETPTSAATKIAAAITNMKNHEIRGRDYECAE